LSFAGSTVAHSSSEPLSDGVEDSDGFDGSDSDSELDEPQLQNRQQVAWSGWGPLAGWLPSWKLFGSFGCAQYESANSPPGQ
jgi:hypothetical protein